MSTELNNKDFRIKQENWRQAVILYQDENGKRLAAGALRVAMAMQMYEHAVTDDKGAQGTAWPRRSSLAKRAGIGGNERTIRREITTHTNALSEAGFIVKVKEGVRPSSEQPIGQAAIWMLTIPEKSLTEIESLFEVGGQIAHQPPEEEGGVSGQIAHQRRGVNHPPTLVGESHTNVGGQIAHPTHSETSSENKLREHTHESVRVDDFINEDQSTNEAVKDGKDNTEPALSENMDEHIRAFQSEYPKRITFDLLKGPYREQIKQGATHEQLLNAAKAYRDECERTKQERRYMKTATTFLEQEHWHDYKDMPANDFSISDLSFDDKPKLDWWGSDDPNRPF